ncbi:thyrotropin receptor-like protein [Sarcoptes scabiei]|uniref:Thyrotropin receptor-like protein n=1 Tax=Sarcoptes scabiei TaxID=52283 RepID=A0A131ZSK4_SARSC|nr:thyrotropin receptor-like protein [Sarcoptes scabiei]
MQLNLRFISFAYRVFFIPRNLGYNQFPDLPTEGITNIIEIKVHGNRNLREFPPVESFPFVQTLAMSYAYHCCLFQDRKQLINSELSSGSLDQLSRFPDTHDSILWLENIKDDNVNLTIDELAQQFWKLYNPQNSIPDIESNDDKRDGFSTNPQQNLNFDMFVNDLHTALRSPNIYQRINMIDDDENLESRVYFQQNSYQTDKPVRCLPRPDPFLPCKDLFDWWTLRLGVWIVFPLALIGNGTVLVVLVFGRRKRRRSSKLDVPRFLVCNLAVADFFMGIYLSMLAIMDAITFGYFRSYAIRWQNSFICQFTGFTGVFSAELSVYTLAVITLERNYAITHAMHLNKRLSLRAASIVMSFGWFFALLMATLPLFGVNDYRKVAVCLPFEIDNLVSLCYVIILIVFNGLAFILLMGCYLRMYCAIRGSQAWNSNDTKIAMRMALLVFTDFLCWAPIAFFTITALLGWQLITLEEAKIFTIFKFFPNVPEFHQYHVRQKDCKKEDNDDAENDKVEKDNKIEQKSEILKQIERDNEERLHRNGNPDGCECQCHQKRRQQHHRHYHHRHQVLAKQPRSKQLSLKDTETIENNQTYGGLFFRNLLSPTLKNIRRTSSSQSKQFKSNSIIYQSNYRKNHIHMTFEEELLHSPLPPNSNEINDDPECSEMKRKFQRISQRQNHQSSRNESYASSMVIGSNQSNRNGNQKEMTEEKQNQKSEENRSNRSDRDDHRRYIKHHHPTTRAMTTGILMLKNKLTRNNKNYLSSDSQYEFSYYSNRKDSTSTTGRLSISSDNPTKSTTSSTFISSGIWNSSTTNQRSSLSNPNENASDSDNNNGDDQQEKELVLNYNQYQRMIELSIRFDARIKNHLLESNNEIDLECKNILEKTSKTTGYILLDFFLNDFYDMVSRKHHLAHPETYRIHNNDQNEIDDDETEQSYRKDLEDYNRAKHIDSEREKSENFDEKNKKKFATDKRKLMILFLLDKIDPATLNRFDCFFSNLEVLLLLERNVDGDGDETSESKRIRLKLGDCQECLELFLIENLINYLDEGFCHIPDEKYFQTLMIDSLIFRCDLTIHRRELMEINEESFTPNSLVSDRYSNGNFNDCSNGQQTKSSKRSPASKMMNSSHEKIMTFIQNLLTKSNGKHSQTEESSSTRRKRSNRSTMRALRRKHPKSIVTEAINQCGKRRSSSAFALSEEIYTKFPEIIYDKQMYVKSCSQLQVLESNESSNSNLNKSDSIPDVRSRSAISDVIIRINEDAIQKSSSNSVYGGSGGITTMLTTNTTTFGTFKTEKILIPTFNSDREISYDGDGFERHRYHHAHKTLHIDEQNNHYHSYEFIA